MNGKHTLSYDPATCLKSSISLNVPPSSKRLIEEKEFIEATSRISSFHVTSRGGVPISPIEIRLTKDRLSLVSRVLSSNADAYKHTEVMLDLVHKLGFRGDPVAEVKTLAMLADTALQVEDFVRSYDISERMVTRVMELRSAGSMGDPAQVREASEVCWVACYQLGRQSEFTDIGHKSRLLSRALELCPGDQLHDVLNARRRLEKEDIARRQDVIASWRQDSTKRSQSLKHPMPPLSANPSSLSSRLQNFNVATSPLMSADPAALASRAFNRVAGHLPFSVGSRGRSQGSIEGDERSRSESRRTLDSDEVSAQATRAFQRGIGWLIGADDE